MVTFSEVGVKIREAELKGENYIWWEGDLPKSVIESLEKDAFFVSPLIKGEKLKNARRTPEFRKISWKHRFKIKR